LKGFAVGNSNIEVASLEGKPLLPLSEARNLLDIVYLANALLRTGGNLSRAAKELGIARHTIYALVEKYGISCIDGKLSIELAPFLSYAELRVPCLENYLNHKGKE